MQRYNEIKIPAKKRNFESPILSEEEIKSILQKTPEELNNHEKFLKNQKLWILISNSFLKFNHYCAAFLYEKNNEYKQRLKKEDGENQKLIKKLLPDATLMDHFKNLELKYNEDFEEYFKNELNEYYREEFVEYLQNYQLNKKIKIPNFCKKSIRIPKFLDYFTEISKDQQDILINFISDPVVPFQKKITRDIYGKNLRISTMVNNACIVFNKAQSAKSS